MIKIISISKKKRIFNDDDKITKGSVLFFCSSLCMFCLNEHLCSNRKNKNNHTKRKVKLQ